MSVEELDERRKTEVWVTAPDYANQQGLPADRDSLRKLGKRAREIGCAHRIEPRRAVHKAYGRINSWPQWVWECAEADDFEVAQARWEGAQSTLRSILINWTDDAAQLREMVEMLLAQAICAMEDLA